MPAYRKGAKKNKKKHTRPNTVVDAFGQKDGSAVEKCGGQNGRNTRTRKSKRERRKDRSPLGFLVAAGVAVAGLATALITSVRNKRRSDSVLQSMRKKPLVVTDHAACRMDCRFITRKNVLESLFRGTVNARKSEPMSRPCPKYVVDVDIRTKEGRLKKVQNVFSACEAETRLVTTIDTSTNWPCGPC
jgi:hypothetical protein